MQAWPADERDAYKPSSPRLRLRTASPGCSTSPCYAEKKIAMRILRQRRRPSVQLRSRRRRRCPENGFNAANGRAIAVSDGAGDRRVWSSKMSDPVYNLLMGLVAVAAVVAVAYYATLTILPRAIIAVGMMACIWGVVENFWGADELED